MKRTDRHLLPPRRAILLAAWFLGMFSLLLDLSTLIQVADLHLRGDYVQTEATVLSMRLSRARRGAYHHRGEVVFADESGTPHTVELRSGLLVQLICDKFQNGELKGKEPGDTVPILYRSSRPESIVLGGGALRKEILWFCALILFCMLTLIAYVALEVWDRTRKAPPPLPTRDLPADLIRSLQDRE